MTMRTNPVSKHKKLAAQTTKRDFQLKSQSFFHIFVYAPRFYAPRPVTLCTKLKGPLLKSEHKLGTLWMTFSIAIVLHVLEQFKVSHGLFSER
jgi:hypothetical protein